MPIPPAKLFACSTQASFTDREEPQQAFQDALAEIEQREYSLLNFYGIGGIGKSRLHRHLQEAHCDKEASNVYSHIDYKAPDKRKLHATLTSLVHNFSGENKIPFVAFGLAYILYWEKAFPNQYIK